jgi:hypothetical protein
MKRSPLLHIYPIFVFFLFCKLNIRRSAVRGYRNPSDIQVGYLLTFLSVIVLHDAAARLADIFGEGFHRKVHNEIIHDAHY